MEVSGSDWRVFNEALSNEIHSLPLIHSMSDSALIIQLIVRKGLVSKEQLRILKEGSERVDSNGLFEELVKKRLC